MDQAVQPTPEAMRPASGVMSGDDGSLKVGGGVSSGVMPLLLVVLVAVGGYFGYTKWFAMSGDWHTTIDSALDEAELTGKPIFTLFTADWCPACKQFETYSLTDADVESKLDEEFVLLKVDLTTNSGPSQRIAMEHGVQVIPSVILFNEAGEQIAHQTGGMGTGQLLTWLDAQLAAVD